MYQNVNSDLTLDGRNRIFFSFLFFFFGFLGPHAWHMEVPRLGVKLDLEPLAYITVTATLDLSLICNLHDSSQQC